MRVLAVDAHAHGPFSGDSLVLAPGLNVITGLNEAGKSSWHSALLLSLIGLRRARGRSLAADRQLVERHKPWDSDKWLLGAQILLDSGQRLSVSWDMAARTARVVDDLGRDRTSEWLSEGTTDLARVAGLDRSSFRAVACVRQGDVLGVRDGASDLQDLLQRAATSASADSSAAAAIESIERFHRDYVGGDRANSKKPLSSAKRLSETKLSAMRSAHREQTERAELCTAITGLRTELAEVKAELAVSEVSHKLAAVRDALADRDALLDELHTLEAAISGAEEQLRINDEWQERLVEQRRARQTETERTSGGLEGAPAASSERPSRPLSSARAGSVAMAVCVLGVAAFLVGLIGGLVADRALLVAAPIGLGFIAVGIRVLRSRKRERSRAFPLQQASAGTGQGAALAATTLEEERSAAESARLCSQRLSGLHERLQRSRDSLCFNDAPTEAELERLEAELRRLREQHPHVPPIPIDRDRISVHHEALLTRCSEIEHALAFRLGELEHRERNTPDVAAATEDYERAMAELRRIEGLDEVLNLTREFLTAAQERIHRDIAPKLNEALSRRLPEVLGTRHGPVLVDPHDLSVRVVTPTGPRSAELLSHGTAEQIYLMLRIALVDVLTASSSESCPLLLDEVTVTSDPQRKRAVLEMLKDIANDRQVVLLTQERDVATWAASELSEPHRHIELSSRVAL